MTSQEVEMSSDAQEQCVELLNKASLSVSESEKVLLLRHVQELIVHQDPALLDNFLDEVVAFQSDTSAEVRKTVLGFIEEACKKDNEMIPKVVANLAMLLQDSFSTAVVKRTIQAVSNIYKICLQWLSGARTVTDLMDSCWSMLTQMKQHIIGFVDHDNDGVRTAAVKFMEMVILLQTYSEPGGLPRHDFCLDGVPITLKIARPRKLEEEARSVFAQMIKFHGSPHISSVNLMTCMGSLTLVARVRPSLIPAVISALESLHANLPPTLSKSQVNSVRKHMKMQLLNLLKQPAAVDSHRNICTLLTDLGASQSEVMKAMPPAEELRKRQRRVQPPADDDEDDKPLTKRQKFTIDDDDDEGDVGLPSAVSAPTLEPRAPPSASAIDLTEQWVVERLTPAMAASIVLVSMANLPEEAPALFSNTFTPISAAGTRTQIQHVSRLLAAQLTHAGIGPGARASQADAARAADDWEMDDDEVPAGSKQQISTVLAGSVGGKKKKVALLPSGTTHKKHMAKALRLPEITHRLPAEVSARHMTEALDRLLAAEATASGAGLAATRAKLLTWSAAHFTDQLVDKLLAHVLEDLRGRADLVFSWLYEEYCSGAGFCNLAHVLGSNANYEQLFCMLISALMVRPDLKDGQILLSRILLEAPSVPDTGVEILRGFSADPSTYEMGINLLQEMINRRPSKPARYATALLQLTTEHNSEVRSLALGLVMDLHTRSGMLAAVIEEFAIDRLKVLVNEEPPLSLEPDASELPAGVTRQWTDELAKHCLQLYLALLPRRQYLIHELSHVYVQTTADVKRTVLRVLEAPIRGMGMDSPELLTLVETCPKGAETLITRVIHILTDKTPPSAELVDRVRDLYQKRVSDVRFLIPVLNGLRKHEVIGALPKLIRLNPVVVKEVFNRLLGLHADSARFSSPLTPVELLVALHNIDPDKCDMKTIIKATGLCFSEKQVYTQEVLAVVLQQLMEQAPLPVLLMRTVIQSLALYNRLIGLVINILQRLIGKKVWTQKKVWEGFIKCCQRTKPSSYQVLLQLPAAPLADVFQSAPELRNALIDHVAGLSSSQRQHVSAEIQAVLSGVPPPAALDLQPMSPAEPSDSIASLRRSSIHSVHDQSPVAPIDY